MLLQKFEQDTSLLPLSCDPRDADQIPEGDRLAADLNPIDRSIGLAPNILSVIRMTI